MFWQGSLSRYTLALTEAKEAEGPGFWNCTTLTMLFRHTTEPFQAASVTLKQLGSSRSEYTQGVRQARSAVRLSAVTTLADKEASLSQNTSLLPTFQAMKAEVQLRVLTLLKVVVTPPTIVYCLFSHWLQDWTTVMLPTQLQIATPSKTRPSVRAVIRPMLLPDLLTSPPKDAPISSKLEIVTGSAVRLVWWICRLLTLLSARINPEISVLPRVCPKNPVSPFLQAASIEGCDLTLGLSAKGSTLDQLRVVVQANCLPERKQTLKPKLVKEWTVLLLNRSRDTPWGQMSGMERAPREAGGKLRRKPQKPPPAARLAQSWLQGWAEEQAAEAASIKGYSQALLVLTMRLLWMLLQVQLPSCRVMPLPWMLNPTQLLIQTQSEDETVIILEPVSWTDSCRRQLPFISPAFRTFMQLLPSDGTPHPCISTPEILNLSPLLFWPMKVRWQPFCLLPFEKSTLRVRRPTSALKLAVELPQSSKLPQWKCWKGASAETKVPLLLISLIVASQASSLSQLEVAMTMESPFDQLTAWFSNSFCEPMLISQANSLQTSPGVEPKTIRSQLLHRRQLSVPFRPDS